MFRSATSVKQSSCGNVLLKKYLLMRYMMILQQDLYLISLRISPRNAPSSYSGRMVVFYQTIGNSSDELNLDFIFVRLLVKNIHKHPVIPTFRTPGRFYRLFPVDTVQAFTRNGKLRYFLKQLIVLSFV